MGIAARAGNDDLFYIACPADLFCLPDGGEKPASRNIP